MKGISGYLRSENIIDSLAGSPGVAGVHDFHVWTVSTGWVSLSAHLIKTQTADPSAILTEARMRLFDRFGIEHITIQIEESGNLDCSTGTCGEVEPFAPSSS